MALDFYAFDVRTPDGYRFYALPVVPGGPIQEYYVGIEAPDGTAWVLTPRDLYHRLEEHGALFYAAQPEPRWRSWLRGIVGR